MMHSDWVCVLMGFSSPAHRPEACKNIYIQDIRQQLRLQLKACCPYVGLTGLSVRLKTRCEEVDENACEAVRQSVLELLRSSLRKVGVGVHDDILG